MEEPMAFTANDVVPLSQARATLSELADQVKAGAEKIITKNGESYVAIIDAARLDYYHQLEREQIHLLIIDDARKGLDDVAAGRVKPASVAVNALKRKRRAVEETRCAPSIPLNSQQISSVILKRSKAFCYKWAHLKSTPPFWMS
jgi:prevent-host-death family protein